MGGHGWGEGWPGEMMVPEYHKLSLKQAPRLDNRTFSDRPNQETNVHDLFMSLTQTWLSHDEVTM